AHPATAPALLDALSRPFAVRAIDQDRLISSVYIAGAAGLWDRCREVLAPLEPFVPWWPNVLGYRAECYERTGDGRARRAGGERDEFLAAQPSAPHAPSPAPAAAPSR